MALQVFCTSVNEIQQALLDLEALSTISPE